MLIFVHHVAMATRLKEQAEAFKLKEDVANQLLMEKNNVICVFVCTYVCVCVFVCTYVCVCLCLLQNYKIHFRHFNNNYNHYIFVPPQELTELRGTIESLEAKIASMPKEPIETPQNVRTLLSIFCAFLLVS